MKVIPDVRVVAFATPACADMGVAKLCDSICTSVILHDDVVPRVTPQAVRALLKDALCTKVSSGVRSGFRATVRGESAHDGCCPYVTNRLYLVFEMNRMLACVGEVVLSSNQVPFNDP